MLKISTYTEYMLKAFSRIVSVTGLHFRKITLVVELISEELYGFNTLDMGRLVRKLS